MANKVKCNTCYLWHGGFHLCTGPKELPPPPGNNHRTVGEKTNSYIQSVWEKNAKRDQGILEAYTRGDRVADIEKAFGLSRTQIRVVVTRLGGVLRDKSWQPEGWVPFNKKEKENA